MAPQKSRKRKSESMEEERDQPAATTPIGSPGRKRMKISQSQKQALIDNLQLEITERARHLRAHYALQATDLRSRIERRINRIPLSLRKANMGELMAKYAEATVANQLPQSLKSTKALPNVPLPGSSRPLPSVPQDIPSSAAKHSNPALASPTKGTKRRSSEIAILSDKENEPAPQPSSLTNPKNPKRAKTTTAASRAASRSAKPNNILSPKSHNSRTLPRSPIKDTNPAHHSPTKPPASYLARPPSPLKPASPLKTAASAATNAISASLHGMVEQARRGGGHAGLRRTACKDKTTTITTTTTSATTAASSREKMAPPPRPATAATAPPQERPASSVSNHSAVSNSSVGSSGTTVVTKKMAAAGGRGKTALSATATRKATGPVAVAKATAVKGANGGGGGGGKAVGKKVVVAEPAAGRRVLRKRG